MPHPLIHITSHALVRYRERAAAYADATMGELLAAFLESVKVEADGDLLPNWDRRSYWHHAATDSYFVVKSLKDGKHLMTTVVTRDISRNYVTPKTKVPAAAQTIPSKFGELTPRQLLREFCKMTRNDSRYEATRVVLLEKGVIRG